MSILDRFHLQGQVAIVTGAGRGIGAAIARAFAEAGASVVLASRTEEQLRQVEAEIIAAGGTALVHPTDVLDLPQLQQLADATMERFGRIDLLVNNAGGFPPAPVANTSADK